MSSSPTPGSEPRTDSSTALIDGRPVDGPGAGLRASDADRHAVVTQLQDAVARGLLTTDEGSQRMAIAYNASYLSELPPLTADLPAPPPPPAATAPDPVGWRALLALLWIQLRLLIAGSVSGRPSRRRLAAVGGIVLAAVIVLVLGTWALHGLFDGPHGDAGGFGGR
jgi:Domain of unknown function (DUF1707)